MSRGDSVEVIVDIGAGASRSFTIEADKNDNALFAFETYEFGD
jgi:hypothetical protein